MEKDVQEIIDLFYNDQTPLAYKKLTNLGN